MSYCCISVITGFHFLLLGWNVNGSVDTDLQSHDILRAVFLSLLVDVMKQIDIPSVFVGEETANSLKEDYTYDKGWVYTQISFFCSSV